MRESIESSETTTALHSAPQNSANEQGNDIVEKSGRDAFGIDDDDDDDIHDSTMGSSNISVVDTVINDLERQTKDNDFDITEATEEEPNAVDLKHEEQDVSKETIVSDKPDSQLQELENNLDSNGAQQNKPETENDTPSFNVLLDDSKQNNIDNTENVMSETRPKKVEDQLEPVNTKSSDSNLPTDPTTITKNEKQDDASDDKAVPRHGKLREAATALIHQLFVPKVAVVSSAASDEIAQSHFNINLKGTDAHASPAFGICDVLRFFSLPLHDSLVWKTCSGQRRLLKNFSLSFRRPGWFDGQLSTAAAYDCPESLINYNLLFSRNIDNSMRSIDLALDSILETDPLQSSNGPLHSDFFSRSRRLRFESAPFAYVLRKLLLETSCAAHEVFGHPMATLIVVSSRDVDCISTVMSLVKVTHQIEYPPYVDPNMLILYLYIHDNKYNNKVPLEESKVKFYEMKRQFGGETCFFIEMGELSDSSTDGNECLLANDCFMQAPARNISNSTSAEDIVYLKSNNTDKASKNAAYYAANRSKFETALQEMSAHAVVPYFEKCIHALNEQVANPRRGFTGRLFLMSRKYFSSDSSRAQAAALSYDISRSCYHFESPDAQLRKLADMLFIMQDYKFASGIYEMTRKTFNNDRAWMYYGAVNEMIAISELMCDDPTLVPSAISLKPVEQAIDAAIYTYISRCSAVAAVCRATFVITHLLFVLHVRLVDQTTFWIQKLMESIVVPRLVYAASIDQISSYLEYSLRTPFSPQGTRRRKAAMWRIIAAQQWVKCRKLGQTTICLDKAANVFKNAREWEYIQDRIARIERLVQRHRRGSGIHKDPKEQEKIDNAFLVS